MKKTKKTIKVQEADLIIFECLFKRDKELATAFYSKNKIKAMYNYLIEKDIERLKKRLKAIEEKKKNK